MRPSLVLPLAVLLMAACSIGPGSGAASSARGSAPSGTPLAKASGALGAQVPMPADLAGLFELDELKKYFTADELPGGTD